MKRKIIFIILSVLWMALIFYMSSRDADLSTQDSHTAGMLVGKIIYRDFDEWPEEEQTAFAEKVDHPVRKTAHATEYAILGGLYCLAIFPPDYSPKIKKEKLLNKTEKKRGMAHSPALPFLVLLLAAIYATTDEIHQIFVPGRSCKFTDVCIDSGGAAVGIMIVTIIFFAAGVKRDKERAKR